MPKSKLPTLEFRTLKKKSYEYIHDEEHKLKECLDKETRGYAYLSINLNSNIHVLIPLRSRLKKNSKSSNRLFLYPVEGAKHKNLYCGLDFSKLIIKNTHISLEQHTIKLESYKEFNYYEKHKTEIIEKAKKYIELYINICKKIEDLDNTENGEQEKRISNIKKQLNKYRYSTLCNYHEKLGISIDYETVELIKNSPQGQSV